MKSLEKEGGWNNYQLLTDKYSDSLEQVISDQNTSMEEKYSKFEKVHDKIKYKAIGKVRISERKNKIYDEEKLLVPRKPMPKNYLKSNKRRQMKLLKKSRIRNYPE